jgi:shikimate dehydrogenase
MPGGLLCRIIGRPIDSLIRDRACACTMTPAPIRACIMGHPVKHSRSPKLHGHWLSTLGIAGEYTLADVAPDDVAAFIRALGANGYAGANVTVPHKVAALGAVDRVEPEAAAIGAVNTLWFEDGRLIGGNTDSYGFLASLDQDAPGWDAHKGRAVVLGAGGAARAIVYGLIKRGLAVTIVNRTVAKAEALADYFGQGVAAAGWEALPALLPGCGLLVNSTSLGMVGSEPLPIALDGLPRGAVVFDAVYVPLETPLLAAARARGNRAVDGLGMLLHQGVPGFERWFGVRPVVTPELRTLIEADLISENK